MKLVMGVREAADFEHDMCPNDCCKFPHIAKVDRMAHVEDTCPTCRAKRFKITGSGANKQAVPVKVMYDLGVENIVQLFHNDPSWRERHASGWEADRKKFMKTGDGSRLHDIMTGTAPESPGLLDPDVLLLHLGGDFGQPFNFKVHSTGIIVMRYVLFGAECV
jgi:hypothetical protein